VGDSPAKAPVVCALSLVDVVDQQGAGLGAAESGGPEEVKQRQISFAERGALVGHPQQPLVLLDGERPRLARGDARTADLSDAFGAERGGERA